MNTPLPALLAGRRRPGPVNASAARRRRLQSLARLLAGLALAAALGCSTTRLTYNYLDWIIDWYLDDYLSLNRHQEELYRQRLEALLRWHRSAQLARYSRFIGRLQQDLRGSPDEAVLRERYAELTEFWRALTERAAPDCAAVLLSLDRAQRRNLYGAAEKKQRELEGRHRGETAADRSRRVRERAEKTIERFTGGLTRSQKARLARWAGGLAPVRPLWLENRRAWLAGLQAVLEGKDAAGRRREGLRRLFVEPEHLWSPAYRRAVRKNEAATITMLAGLLATLTDRQRRHAQERLESLRGDLLHLSRQKP